VSSIIKNLVDRGLVLRTEIAERQKELKGIETALETFGLDSSDQHIELKDADREGRQWLAIGTEMVVPIIFTADKIIGSFQKHSVIHERVRAALGKQGSRIVHFYEPVTTYKGQCKDGKAFRKLAQEMLGTGAPAFITACVVRDKHGLAQSDIKIEWDAAESVPEAAS